MKNIVRDSISFFPENNLDKFEKQFFDSKKEAEDKGAIGEKTVGISYDGEISIYFERHETDYEYDSRTKKDQELINKELKELARLKAKYGE